MPIEIDGRRFFSIPEAAEEVHIPYRTLIRKVNQGLHIGDEHLEVYRDALTDRPFLPEEVVEKLRPHNRIKPD